MLLRKNSNVESFHQTEKLVLNALGKYSDRI